MHSSIHGRCLLDRTVKPSDDSTAAGQPASLKNALKPEHHFSPVPYQVAVAEFEHGRFLRYRLTAGDHGGDDHIAAAVEGERQHRFRRWGADRIAAAAAFHPVHRNGPAGAECRSFVADEVDVADAIEFLVVGHPRLTIAKADLRPQVEIDVNPAIRRLALNSPPPDTFVDSGPAQTFVPHTLRARSPAISIHHWACSV